MAVNALAIDSMLPALPNIVVDLGISDENHRQWVIGAYLLGFGGAQLFVGTLSDRYGRKPVLLASLSLYVVCSLAAAWAQSFDLLIAARIVQGLGAAASRVLTVSIIRDCYSGRRMAQVMSLAFIVFLIMPAVAPALGQGVILAGSWRWIFGGLGVFAAVLIGWVTLRLPGNAGAGKSLPIEVKRIARRCTPSSRRASLSAIRWRRVSSSASVRLHQFGHSRYFPKYSAGRACSRRLSR